MSQPLTQSLNNRKTINVEKNLIAIEFIRGKTLKI